MRTTNFDRVARAYRWMEYLSFGPWLTLCRNAQLKHLHKAKRALILGDGDGRFLERLLENQPELTADVIDSSQAMLHLLDGRIRRRGLHGHITLHHADALTCHLSGSYDLLVSHFFLDCFFPEEVERLLDRVLAHAAPELTWLISEFALPQNAGARWFARGLIYSLYRAFGWLTGLPVCTLPDHAAAMRRRGFVLIHQRQFLAGLLSSEIWSLKSNAP